MDFIKGIFKIEAFTNYGDLRACLKEEIPLTALKLKRSQIMKIFGTFFILGHGIRHVGWSGPGGGDLHGLLPRPRLRVHGHHATRLHGHLRCCQHSRIQGSCLFIYF